jgi:uncharacterized protein (DUF1800 family)
MTQSSKPPENPFAPYVPSKVEPFDNRRLCHLLRRCAFGVTVDRLDKGKAKEPFEIIDWLLEYDPQNDPFEGAASELEGFINFDSSSEVASYWFYRMMNSPQPFQERMALFWHNRFATGAAKVVYGRLMAGQIDTFRKLGTGSFHDLLVAMSKDPAMLLWLDGNANRKGKANENYGREVMELFTLGIGNYTEDDVKQIARAFTGWRVEGEEAIFDRKLHDEGVKTFLGRTGNFAMEDACRIILQQPAAPRHLARHLLQEFVHPEPLDSHIDFYAKRLLEYDWNVKLVLRDMLSSRLFFSDWAYRSKIKCPVVLAVGAALAMGGKVDCDFLRNSCVRLGQNLLNPPNVKGWPGERSWINANTVLLRFNFAMEMATQRRREFVRRSELDPWLEANHIKSANDVLNVLADLLLDGDLPPEARVRFLDYMNRDSKNAVKPFKLTHEMINLKVRDVMHMMMTMPEYQLA